MNKKRFVGIVTFMLIVIAGISVYITHNNSSADGTRTSSVSSSPIQNDSNSVTKNQNQVTGQLITITGTVECLTPKTTSSQQATSCAIGLKQDDGTSYAITSPDPVTTGSLPTGQRVQVSGTLSQQSSQFDIAGIVNVTSIQTL